METILLPDLWFTNFTLGGKKTEIVNYENFFMLYLVGKALIRTLYLDGKALTRKHKKLGVL